MYQNYSVMSMTALGNSDFDIGQRSYHVEIKSVNAKSLEIKVFLPDHLSSAELTIRSALKGISRGKIEIRIVQNKTQSHSNQQQLFLDQEVAKNYIDLIDEVSSLTVFGQETSSFSPIALLQLPGVLQNIHQHEPQHQQINETQQQELLLGIQKALEHHLDMRKKEGTFLANVLLRHLQQIEDYQKQILSRIPEFQKELKAKTKERVMNLVLDIYQIINDNEMNALHIDQNRIATELGILVEKTDITEEMDRLSSHIKQMRDLISSPCEQGIGRKCDFICQELLREVNTTGSKANDVEILKQVIDLKVEIERLREQIQNIE